MKTSDGSTVSDIVGICESWVSFYSDIFSASSVDLDFQVDLLDNLSLSLSCNESATCEGPIPLTEFHAALLGMAKGKSSGSDGPRMKWDLFGKDLVEVFNASLEAGLLPSSQHEALIDLFG